MVSRPAPASAALPPMTGDGGPPGIDAFTRAALEDVRDAVFLLLVDVQYLDNQPASEMRTSKRQLMVGMANQLPGFLFSFIQSAQRITSNNSLKLKVSDYKCFAFIKLQLDTPTKPTVS